MNQRHKYTSKKINNNNWISFLLIYDKRNDIQFHLFLEQILLKYRLFSIFFIYHFLHFKKRINITYSFCIKCKYNNKSRIKSIVSNNIPLDHSTITKFCCTIPYSNVSYILKKKRLASFKKKQKVVMEGVVPFM